jgi:glutathione peroxidase-family protein
VLESNFYQEYKDQGDGFTVLQLIAEDFQSQTPTVQELAGWKAAYGLNFPVLADPYWGVGGPVGNNYIPFYWVVDQERVIHKKSNYLNQFPNTIEDLLGID